MQVKKRSVKIDVIHVICVSILAALFQTLFVLAIVPFHGTWSDVVYYLVLTGGTVFNAVLLAVELITYFLGKQVVYRCCIIIYVLAIFIAAVAYALIETGFLEVIRDADKLEEYLDAYQGWAAFIFILLQFSQVVFLPIPSTVTVAAGTALFGPLLGSVYSLIGIMIGSLFAFLVGRYAGYRVVAWIIGKDTLETWLEKIKGKDKLFLSAMFLLPVFPDDVLCFVAGLSSMSILYFAIVILISRVLAIFVTSYAIALIPFTTWWGILIWCIFAVAVIALFVVLYKKSDAILAWIDRVFHRETRVTHKKEKNEFEVEIIDADGSIVTKGVAKNEKTQISPDQPPEK